MKKSMKEIFKFHGRESPGTAVGAFMADFAVELMNKFYKIDVTDNKVHKHIYCVVETDMCLPDSAQIITGCTTGNKKLKVMNHNKFAITLYYWDWNDTDNRDKGFGVRVYIDTCEEKQNKYKNFYDWFLKRKSKKELPKDLVMKDITSANRDILKYKKVMVKCSRNNKFRIMFCKICGEPCPVNDSGICRGCSGEEYYTVI